MDECRKQFEAWLREKHPDDDYLPLRLGLTETGYYKNEHILRMYTSWQAAWNRSAARPSEPVAEYRGEYGDEFGLIEYLCHNGKPLQVGDKLYLHPAECKKCAELEKDRVEAVQRGDDLVVKNIELEQANFRLAAGQCIVDGGLCGDEHGNQYCSLQKQFYRKVLMPISHDGSVTEERYVRCENCYDTVAELFVSKKTHDAELAALEAENARLAERCRDLQSQAETDQQIIDEQKKTLNAIDAALRGNVCDPDPLPIMYQGSASWTTTYGLVSGIKRERDMLKNKVELLEEDIECAHMGFDKHEIPRNDGHNTYSLNGRLKFLVNNLEYAFEDQKAKVGLHLATIAQQAQEIEELSEDLKQLRGNVKAGFDRQVRDQNTIAQQAELRRLIAEAAIPRLARPAECCHCGDDIDALIATLQEAIKYNDKK